ncbi:MAG: histidine kinase [Chitinophagaceae bacterium]
MKLKLWHLLLGFVVFYYLMHATYDLPNLLSGRLRWLPDGPGGLLVQLFDIAAGFLFALVPYMILFRCYPSGKITAGAISLLVLLAIVIFINYGIFILKGGKSFRLRSFFTGNLFFFCVYFVYGVVFYFVRYTQYKQLEQKELVLQNRQAELSFLRSQINPHFLFNSLNNIYALVYEGSDQALPAIAGLSDLLRYMLYDSSEKVPIKKEWEYILKYIDLQKLRFDHPVQVNVHISGSVDNVQIPPLLLVPFVENAFKHGDFSGSNDQLVVTLYSTAVKTNFHCFNRKGTGNKDAGGGIGLANVKRRLNLLYPDKHLLYIEDGEDTFTVTIELLHD